jgi:hypothetical protein
MRKRQLGRWAGVAAGLLVIALVVALGTQPGRVAGKTLLLLPDSRPSTGQPGTSTPTCTCRPMAAGTGR